MAEQREGTVSVNPVQQEQPVAVVTPADSNVGPEVGSLDGSSPADTNWHADAGRKGAYRVHQLIQEGKLYEKEHGLKSGRQRLRQLIDLGKLYEQEHGLRPGRPKRRERVSTVERQELLMTFLHCLVRIAKPSFRAELTRLLDKFDNKPQGTAA